MADEPAGDVDLSLATLDQIVDELGRRHATAVVVLVDNCRDGDQGFAVLTRGSAVTAIGGLAQAMSFIGRQHMTLITPVHGQSDEGE